MLETAHAEILLIVAKILLIVAKILRLWFVTKSIPQNVIVRIKNIRLLKN